MTLALVAHWGSQTFRYWWPVADVFKLQIRGGKCNCVLCLRVNIFMLLCVLCSSITGVLKSGRMRWAVHMTHMGDRLGAYGVFVGRPE